MSKSFGLKLKAEVERFNFEVGILEDKPHMLPVETSLFKEPELGSYAGGPVRKTTRVKSDKTVGDVFKDNQERLNRNLLLEPFQDQSSEINRFTTAFLKLVTKQKISLKRVENLLQAIVRNPILRKDYGNNNATTADNKGFDRNLFDTGQMFKAIRAKVKRV